MEYIWLFKKSLEVQNRSSTPWLPIFLIILRNAVVQITFSQSGSSRVSDVDARAFNLRGLPPKDEFSIEEDAIH
jgi:hypothetical protein